MARDKKTDVLGVSTSRGGQFQQLNGAAELGLACALRKSHTRSIAGYASAAFLVAVFPANVEMMRRWVLQSRRKAVVSVLRLPLQIPLIYGAWRVGKRNVG